MPDSSSQGLWLKAGGVSIGPGGRKEILDFRAHLQWKMRTSYSARQITPPPITASPSYATSD